MTTTTTTLKIASNDMIYSIGLFRWIEEAIMPFDDVNAAKLIDGLGIRDDQHLHDDHRREPRQPTDICR